MKQPPSLRDSLLDATWQWCGDELRAGREISWDDLAPIRGAFALLRDGGVPEKAADIAGTNNISLAIWERALDIHHGAVPPAVIPERETRAA